MGKEMPMISIVVPVYNMAGYMERCLDSLLAQTYPNIEILLIDDASSDSSGKICDIYAAHDSRVQAVHFPANRGPSAARNEGVRRSKGAFVSFVDSDDYAEPDLLENLYACLLETGADISACGADGIKLEGGPAGTFSQREAICCLAAGKPFNLVPWGKLYRIELAKKCPFDERAFYSEDLLFLYHAIKHSHRISYIPDKLYHYVNREGSQVHSGISERKCTALAVHNIVCADAAKHFPEALPGFQQIALDTDVRMAMLAVEGPRNAGQALQYLCRLQKNTRRHFSWNALSLCTGKKCVAGVLLLRASVAGFWAVGTVWKYIKRLRSR